MAAIRAAGGFTVAQDRASSAVYGMPRVAAEAGAACAVLPLERIASALLAGAAPLTMDSACMVK
jgi:two-component system chemotaxis response regulator CheB